MMNTRFSEFIRNASAEEKEAVYMRVLDAVAHQQQKVLDYASRQLICYHCLAVSRLADLKRVKKYRHLKACPGCGHTTFYMQSLNTQTRKEKSNG